MWRTGRKSSLGSAYWRERSSIHSFFPLRKNQLAVCKDNVTDLSVADSQKERGEGANTIKTFICQSTIIPANGRGFHAVLSSQSITLADTFLG